jgi:hypothetical protein
MEKDKTTILDSYSVHGRGILLELSHAQEGFTKGTLLTSHPSNLKWEVSCRILFKHAEPKQKVFPNEEIQYMILHFANEGRRNQSILSILEKENQNIFQYFVKPVGHHYKPEKGEILTVEINS